MRLEIELSANQVRRIKKAGRRCGWKADDSARFARTLLLRWVGAILKSHARRRVIPLRLEITGRCSNHH